MSGARQLCPECGSPFDPCRCERDAEYIAPPGSITNSTLGVRKGGGLRSGSGPLRKSLTERYADDPTRYGPIFREVRALLAEGRCMGREHLVGHRCGIGVAPASAHHLGRTDLEGLVPACAKMHDDLHERASRVDLRLREAGSPDLETLGARYVRDAVARLRERGELPEELARNLDG